MGQYLEKPITDKETSFGNANQCFYCCSSMQGKFKQNRNKYQLGWRVKMEDSSFFQTVGDMTIFGIFDGHGGQQISKFISNHFVTELVDNPNYKLKQYKLALEETFKKLDEMLLLSEHEKEINSYKQSQTIRTNCQENTAVSFVGSTALVGLMTNDNFLYIANLGDSKCFLNREDEIITLSEDHTPYRVSEWERIERAGGFVDENGLLNGTLSVARAFGDYEFKNENHLEKQEQMVISTPEIRKIKLKNTQDKYLFLGCDGIFEKRNYLEVSDLLNDQLTQNRIYQSQDLVQVMDNLLNLSIAEDTKSKFVQLSLLFQAGYGCDNMSAILIYFHQ